MKKKLVITWVLVFMFVAGAVPVFAQYYYSYIDPNEMGATSAGFRAKSLEIDFIEYKNITGQPYILSNKDDPKRTQSSVNKDLMDKTKCRFQLKAGDYLTTSKGCFIYFRTTSDKKNYKMNERSSIEVIDDGGQLLVMVRSGRVFAGDEIQACRMIDFSSYAVDEAKVKKYVSDLKKDPKFKNNNGGLVDEIVIQKTRKGQFLTAINGLLPTTIALAAGHANTMIQWANQAELAYAIACVYGHSPNTLSNFKTDLIFILAGEDLTRKALSSLRSDAITKAQRDSLEKVIGTHKMKTAVPSTVLDKFTATTLQALSRQMTSNWQAMVDLIPIVGNLASVTINAVETMDFGVKADKYYRK